MNEGLGDWLGREGFGEAAALVRTLSVPIASAAHMAELGVLPIEAVCSLRAALEPVMAQNALACWKAMRREDRCEEQRQPLRPHLSVPPAPPIPRVAAAPQMERWTRRRVSATSFVQRRVGRTESPSPTVVIDSREQKQREVEAALVSHVALSTLPVGDYTFVGCDGSMRECIIERKTDSDLASSVVDARYRLQKAAMRRSLISVGSEPRLVYMSEAEVRTLDRSSAKRVQGALASTALRDGMAVVRSQSTHQTALWLDAFAMCAQRRLPPGPHLDTWSAAVKEQQSHRASKSLLARLLRVVRGASHDFAVKVASSHPTLVELFSFLETVREQDGDIVADFALAKTSTKGGMLSENASLALRQILCSTNYRVL